VLKDLRSLQMSPSTALHRGAGNKLLTNCGSNGPGLESEVRGALKGRGTALLLPPLKIEIKKYRFCRHGDITRYYIIQPKSATDWQIRILKNKTKNFG